MVAVLHSYGPPLIYFGFHSFYSSFTHGMPRGLLDLVAAKCSFSLIPVRKIFLFRFLPLTLLHIHLEKSQLVRMASEENLHISIGGMLYGDVSRVLYATHSLTHWCAPTM